MPRSSDESPRCIRVLPAPPLTASNSVRSTKAADGLSVWNTCTQCAPPSVERQAPAPATAAYPVPAAFGSYWIFVIPPWNQSEPPAAGLGFGGVFDWRSVDRANDAPPSVEV